MKRVTRKEINKLISAPLCFALLMENQELEEVIAAFVSVLNKRERGGSHP